MFNSKALKKKKHSDDEMDPKEAYEISEEKEQYRKQKGKDSFLSAKTHVSSPILTAKSASEFSKGIGSIDSIKYKPSLVGAVKTKYEPSLVGAVKTKYEPSLVGAVKTKYEPSLVGSVATKYEPSDLGIATKGMKEEAPKKAKTKTESRLKMEALIAAAAKKKIGKKGEIINFKEGEPASKKDKILIEKEMKKVKKAK